MKKILSLGTLVLFVQCYLSADTSSMLLSNENANSFLQTKSRNRRGLHEGLREECCYENCDFEERAEFSESYGWEAVGDALCEVSNVEKDRVHAKQGQDIIMNVEVIVVDTNHVNAREQKTLKIGKYLVFHMTSPEDR